MTGNTDDEPTPRPVSSPLYHNPGACLAQWVAPTRPSRSHNPLAAASPAFAVSAASSAPALTGGRPVC